VREDLERVAADRPSAVGGIPGALGGACNGTHEFGKVSFGTEASLFHIANVPTVICGPGHIAQAHQPNEWVSVDQLARCEAFMRRLADRVCVA